MSLGDCFFTSENTLKESVNIDNYFTLLGLDECFDIVKTKLEDCYDEILSKIHPDLFVNSSEIEKKNSLLYASQVKEACDVLANPYRRALHLLQLKYRKPQEKELKNIEPAFLMHMLELQEALEKPDKKIQEGLIQKVESLVEEIQQKLSLIFQEFISLPNEHNYKSAISQLGKLKFALNLEQKIIEIQENE